MKKVIEIKISNDVCSFIESKMYEVNSRKDLLTYAMALNQSIDTDSFRTYHQEFVEFKREYDMAVEAMLNEYVRPVMRENSVDIFNYNVNFEKSVVEIIYEE